jgi:hypothetical protein
VKRSDQLFCTEHLFCYVSDHGSCNGIFGLMQAFDAVMPHGQGRNRTDTRCFRFEILTVVDTRKRVLCRVTPCSSAVAYLCIMFK